MARLPVPGSDEGTWGDVLNTFLTVEHNVDGTLKTSGTIAGKADDTAVVHLAGSETVTGNKNFTGTLQHNGAAVVDTNDARLTDQTGYYPPQAYGFFATSSLPRHTNDQSTFFGIFLARMWIPAGKAITTVAAYVTTAGTVGGGGENSFAVYDDNGTFIASTPSNNNLWSVTGLVQASFSTPIPAQSAGRFVYVACMCNGYSSSPYILYAATLGNSITGGIGLPSGKRHGMYASASSYPASFDSTTYGSSSNYLPFIGLA